MKNTLLLSIALLTFLTALPAQAESKAGSGGRILPLKILMSYHGC